MRIAILYICTGKYKVFWNDFYTSAESKFLPNVHKEYFVFTDAKEIAFEKENARIHKIYQKNLGWPGNAIKRYHIFEKSLGMFKDFDYIFFFNANCVFQEIISEDEILPCDTQNFTACLHPSYYNISNLFFNYERNIKSTAYIKTGEGEHYFQSALTGGRSKDFVDAILTMKKNIDIDLKNKIIAVWHDESHWNRFLVGRKDIKVLSPAYLYPENYVLPFDKKIITIDKNRYGGHFKMRNSNIKILRAKLCGRAMGIVHAVWRLVQKLDA